VANLNKEEKIDEIYELVNEKEFYNNHRIIRMMSCHMI